MSDDEHFLGEPPPMPERVWEAALDAVDARTDVDETLIPAADDEPSGDKDDTPPVDPDPVDTDGTSSADSFFPFDAPPDDKDLADDYPE